MKPSDTVHDLPLGMGSGFLAQSCYRWPVVALGRSSGSHQSPDSTSSPSGHPPPSSLADSIKVCTEWLQNG